MRIEKEIKNVRVFEEGDIIIHYKFNWVAIRSSESNFESWVNSNPQDNNFSDNQVQMLLDSNRWLYVGNSDVLRNSFENDYKDVYL